MIRRLLRRRPADSGSGSLEFAFLSVAFLLLVFMTVQVALLYHARNVVKAEAEGVARAVRAYPSTATGPLRDSVPTDAQVYAKAAQEAAERWKVVDPGETTSNRKLDDARVDDYNQVLITVSADPIMLLPGVFGGDKLRIRQTAGGPFEVFKRSGED